MFPMRFPPLAWIRLPGRDLVPVALVGLVGGAAGTAYLGILQGFERVLGPGHHGAWARCAILLGTGLLLSLGGRWWGSTGNVEILVDNIHIRGGVEGLRELASLVPLSLACVAAGGALGPEAPLVQTTGTLGSWIGTRRRADVRTMRVLSITGMAAGFTVLFGAPLGASIFALEILHRRGLQYYEAILPALIGSLSGFAFAVAARGVGLHPVWRLPSPGDLRGVDLLWAILMGVGGSLVGVLFVAACTGLRRAARLLRAPWRPVAAGLALAALGSLSAYSLTFGEVQLGGILSLHLTVTALAVAAAAKLAGAAVTLSGEWKGGFIIPMFFVGAALGEIVHGLVPDSSTTVLVTAGMVAVNVALTKTPIGSTLVVTEMAGAPLLPTTALAAVAALLLTNRLSFFEAQRDRTDLQAGVPAGRSQVSGTIGP